MKNLKQLAEELDFTTEAEYCEYIVNSLINGQRQQVRELLRSVSSNDRGTVKQHLKEYATQEQLIEIYSLLWD